ncbi:unnamed protein product [Cuscuta epithymum]|uniref:Uncharacterized protein n=1 Tax=Cuscuta epithymum TaxID=186058 RepID=A0AAV0CVU3_9ASTE|nr:unnamed protein product [Cuscuta epithymum]
MAAISVFKPTIDEVKWVNESWMTIQTEHIIEINFRANIFQVPQLLKETKPEAYTPHLLGLGPYHHLRPDLHHTGHQTKLTLHKKFMKKAQTPSNNVQYFPQDYLKRVLDIEPAVRACYDQYLELSSQTLVFIIILDSFFLLDYLGSYNDNTDVANLQPGHKEVAKDILMLENQIPSQALVVIGKELGLFSTEKGTFTEMLYSQVLYYFCKAHSPLRVSEKGWARRNKSNHLLAHMHCLIVNKAPPSPIGPRAQPSYLELGTEILTLLNELGLGGAIVKPLLFGFKAAQVLESSLLAQAVVGGSKELKVASGSGESDTPHGVVVVSHIIPSASELSEKHGVEFRVLELNEGVKRIRFESFEQDHAKPTIFLPEITFKYDSELVLRNLVAYEAAVSTQDSFLELGEYVDLMIDLLQTEKDVGMLREKGIIKGDALGDGEVVEIFHGMGKYRAVGKSRMVSASKKVVIDVKEMVEKWEKMNEKAWKRVQRSVEKEVKDLVKVMRKPCTVGLKYLLYIFLAVLVVLQIMQAYCQVYGCRKVGSQSG